MVQQPKLVQKSAWHEWSRRARLRLFVSAQQVCLNAGAARVSLSAARSTLTLRAIHVQMKRRIQVRRRADRRCDLLALFTEPLSFVNDELLGWGNWGGGEKGGGQ